MKTKDKSLISIIILFIFAFLLEGPLLSVFYSVIYSVTGVFLVCLVITISLFITFKPYLNLSNTFKILLATVVIFFLKLLTFATFRLSHKMISNLLIMAIIVGLFFWITRIRIKADKRLLLSSIAVIAAFAVGIITSLIDGMIAKMNLPILTNDFMYFLSTLNPQGTLFGELPILAMYTPICIILAYFNSIIPEDAKPLPPKKAVSEEEEAVTEIPDGMWRCMGCGEILSEDIKICECGYKKSE